MFADKVEVVASTGDVIEFHLDAFDTESGYGIIRLSNGNQEIILPVLEMDIGQETNTLELSIKFRDLTVYADPSTFQRLRASLVDLEQNDGENRATGNDMGMHEM